MSYYLDLCLTICEIMLLTLNATVDSTSSKLWSMLSKLNSLLGPLDKDKHHLCAPNVECMHLVMNTLLPHFFSSLWGDWTFFLWFQSGCDKESLDYLDFFKDFFFSFLAFNLSCLSFLVVLFILLCSKWQCKI